MQALPAPEVPPEFDPALNRPELGEPCYVIGRPAVDARLHALAGPMGAEWTHGTATLIWSVPGETEPRLRCFRASLVTSSLTVATTPALELRRYGWNLP
jgi:hypothetical protein